MHVSISRAQAGSSESTDDQFGRDDHRQWSKVGTRLAALLHFNNTGAHHRRQNVGAIVALEPSQSAPGLSLT